MMFKLNKKKPLVLAVVAVVTFALFLSPTLAVNDVMAKDKKNKGNDSDQDIDPVSYTHLTLPTILRV